MNARIENGDFMASMACFRKMREDNVNGFYAYGPHVQSLTSELIFDKESQQPNVAADDLGYIGRKAAGKIVELYLERGVAREGFQRELIHARTTYGRVEISRLGCLMPDCLCRGTSTLPFGS